MGETTPTETTPTATEASLPPGHVGGPNLPVAAIGDPVKGEQLCGRRRASTVIPSTERAARTDRLSTR